MLAQVNIHFIFISISISSFNGAYLSVCAPRFYLIFYCDERRSILFNFITQFPTFPHISYLGKWLNHCIGGRNYVAFLMCVLSAVIAVLVILAACIAEITIYYFKPEWLNIWSGSNVNFSSDDNKNDTLIFNNVDGGGVGTGNNGTIIINEVIEQANVTLIGNLTNVLIAASNGTTHNGTASTPEDGENLGLSINGTIFVIFAATVGLLAAISAGLLLHLCFFHVYISYLGLTTYEYIRQQRSTNVTYPPALYQPKNGTHKKENGTSTQMREIQNNGTNAEVRDTRYTSFFRSKSAEADFYFCSNVNPTGQVPVETIDIESQNRPKTLYCCDRVESHHHRHKAYYMCSVMEENPVVENSMRDLSRINYYPDDEARYESKTFHCCSEFVESTDNQGFNPDLSGNAIGTVTGMLEQSRREAFLHYTEQCTFCSFRIKTPAKRQHISVEDKRCCIKTVAKHHRWRRKWNCCSNVPDSPDVPMMGTQPINVPQQVLPSTVLNVRSLNEQNPVPTMLQQQSTNDQRNNNTEINSNTNTNANTTISYEENSANNNNVSIINGNNNTQTDTFLMNRNSPNNNTTTTNNGNESDIQQIITISSSLSNVSSSSTTTIMPPSSSSSNNPTPSKRIRVRGIRPVIRLRHMFRVLGKRYRRPRCRHSGAPAAVQVKQNQIRPLPGTEEASGITNINYNDIHQQEESNNGQYSTITHQTILPTSAIRNETIAASYHQQLYTLPALPPPQRRKIRTTEDIQDLADTLSLVQQQTTTTTTTTPSTIIRLSTPNVNSNIFQSNGGGGIAQHRRHSRRKQILRPRSPTLSPIHESGLSNPTSPMPCHRQNSGETPDDDDYEDDITSSISSLTTNAHLCAKLHISPNVSPNKRQVQV